MTANDSDVSDGDILTGSQVVKVYGQNLTAPFVTLTFGEVEYTPLAQGEGYIEFILGDNGTATISVDGSPFMSFEVEGNVVPDGLPTFLRMRQTKSDYSEYINSYSNIAKCLNYPFVASNDYPIFVLELGENNIPFVPTVDDDFSGHNCTAVRVRSSTDSRTIVNIRILEISMPAYVEYKGFIIAVLNYTTD